MHLSADLAMALSSKADRATLGAAHVAVASRPDTGSLPGAPDDDEATCPICQLLHATGPYAVAVELGVARLPEPAEAMRIPAAEARGDTRRLSLAQPRAPPLA